MALTAKTSTTPRDPKGRGFGDIDPGHFAGSPQVQRMAVVLYEFAVDGSPVPHATAGMGMGVYLPANALIKCVWTQVITAVAGATNIYESLENDGDLLVSGTIAANEYDVSGDVVVGSVADIVAQTAVETTAVVAASRVITTVAREVIFGCTVAAVSAGKFVNFIEYVLFA